MNTIPLTFNEHQISGTILGGRGEPEPDSLNISVILINTTGSHFKIQVFEELLKCNFHSIISIEPDSGNYNIEEISHRYPQIKFIIPHEKVNEGELINMAVAEIKSEYFFVLKDSIYIPSGIILPNLAQNLTKEKLLCVVPRLVSETKSSIAIQKSPSVARKKFAVDSSTYVSDGISTLYPFDYIALYNTQKFIQLGGFDYTITSSYWQKLDFGVRAWLWGEKIKITTALQLSYAGEVPVEDATPSLDSLRFFLKNQMPRMKNDQASVSRLHFWSFLLHSGCGFWEARRQFHDAEKWIETNKYRFVWDLSQLLENWV